MIAKSHRHRTTFNAAVPCIFSASATHRSAANHAWRPQGGCRAPPGNTGGCGGHDSAIPFGQDDAHLSSRAPNAMTSPNMHQACLSNCRPAAPGVSVPVGCSTGGNTMKEAQREHTHTHTHLSARFSLGSARKHLTDNRNIPSGSESKASTECN